MARMLRASAVLTLGCSALQLAPDAATLCEGGTLAYEAVQHSPAACTVYCVPEGQCELMAQTGKLRGYGITAQGNCQRRGFTDAKEFGNVSMRMVSWLKTLTGPCKGMTLARKFDRPAAPGEPAAAQSEPAAAPGGQAAPLQGGPICGYEHVAYEAINPAFPGVCSVFCVPDGLCNGQAIAGQMGYLGITGQGNCQGKGFTERAQLGGVAQKTEAYFKSLVGRCAGMTLVKFQKPPAEAAQGRSMLCAGGLTAYEAIAPHNPGMCSVYCIPEGDCEGQVQTGSMSHLGITGQGNCHAKGYTERMQYSTPWAEHVQGPCKGMEVAHFQRAGAAEQR